MHTSKPFGKERKAITLMWMVANRNGEVVLCGMEFQQCDSALFSIVAYLYRNILTRWLMLAGFFVLP